MMNTILVISAITCMIHVTLGFDSVPLNLRDTVDWLNQYRQFQSNFSSALIPKRIKLGHFESSHFWHNGFTKLIEARSQLKNISHECVFQMIQLGDGLRSEEEWALNVLDSFGKLPSGIMEGNFAWLGEFSECFNITAFNQTWKGKYSLVSSPVDPLAIFKPSASMTFKYGICMPNKCTGKDISEIINLVLNPIPDQLKLFQIKINESFVLVKDPKVLDTDAITTLWILGAIVSLVLLATLFDVFKRFRFEAKYTQLTNVNLNSDDDTLIQQPNSIQTSSDLIEEKNFDQLYLAHVANEPILKRILVNLSAFTNSKKVFETNSNSTSQLKCLNGIRVLSFSWIVLGHTYIFAFAFSDNLNIVNTWIRQFHMMIVSNALFSVDSFFFLSGFLTCYVFMREVSKTGFCVFMLFKYYFHRLWRLTPLYAIVFLISLNLSPYFSDSPLYPPMGWEPDYCKYNWWINFLYLNNLIQPDKMCFGLAWYLANDTQFHFIAPVILIPFALNKKRLGYLISALLLIGNSIAIALTMYYKEGIESAQYGPNFNIFFSQFYVLPWCRIGPYIIGILTAHIFIHSKKSIRINKVLDSFLWLVSLAVLGLVLFGVYPDAHGENPLSRTTRIIYQSFSRTVWAIALGYIVFSCAHNPKNLVNKILGCSFWSPLSKINYSTFLIHVLVIVYFNAVQEHLIHLQHSVIISLFIVNWIVSYGLGYFFNVLFEAPLVSLEKIIL